MDTLDESHDQYTQAVEFMNVYHKDENFSYSFLKLVTVERTLNFGKMIYMYCLSFLFSSKTDSARIVRPSHAPLEVFPFSSRIFIVLNLCTTSLYQLVTSRVVQHYTSKPSRYPGKTFLQSLPRTTHHDYQNSAPYFPTPHNLSSITYTLFPTLASNSQRPNSLQITEQ